MVYTIKSIITYEEIPIPNCMYTQKNINADSLISGSSRNISSLLARDLITDQVIRLLKTPSKDMAELVKRQEKILVQLEELQEQIRKIKKHCNTSPNVTVCAPTTLPINLPSEIVINVSTDYMPISLALIQNVLAKYILLNITYHIHSTVSNEGAKKVGEFVKQLQVTGEKKNKPSLNIRLIFKDVDAKMELITKEVAIIGEVNVLRYIARLLPAYLPYGEDHESDTLLDACHLMQRLSTPVKQKQVLQKTITANLEKHNFLTGQSLTIVDVAVYSMLKNCNIPGSNNPNTQKWMHRVLTAVNTSV